jgi:TnpA family transposase
VTSPGVPALIRDRLHHVDQNYVRVDTLAAANTALVEAQAEIRLAQVWGGGLLASIDGIRFVVPVRSIHARPNPKFFGRKRGITWLNMLNDQSAGLAAKVLSGTPRDSLNVIDVVQLQRGGKVPEAIITDTGSYSDIVFGLLHLIGIKYRPQLANLPDQRLWRFDGNADYGPLNQAARGHIDPARVAAYWEDMCRVAVSIHSCEVSAHDVTRMISRDGNPTPLGQAIAHYGRIFKTLHILRLADDEPYRREGKAQANLVEGRHDLARRIYHGKKGDGAHLLRRHGGPALLARVGTQLHGSVEHRLQQPRRGTSTRPGLSGARHRRRATVGVHPRPHRHRRPLRLPPARPGRQPPAAARSRQPQRLRIRSLTMR